MPVIYVVDENSKVPRRVRVTGSLSVRANAVDPAAAERDDVGPDLGAGFIARFCRKEQPN